MKQVYDDPAAFAAAVRMAQRAATRKRRPKERMALPRAERQPATGLTSLLVAGWSYTFVVGRGHRLMRGVLDTGFLESEGLACDAAKKLGQK